MSESSRNVIFENVIANNKNAPAAKRLRVIFMPVTAGKTDELRKRRKSVLVGPSEFWRRRQRHCRIFR
jgi:hypothetical protein